MDKKGGQAMSDYDRWFISTDGTNTAILCKRERLIDALKECMGIESGAGNQAVQEGYLLGIMQAGT